MIVQLGVDSQGSGEHPVVSHFPQGFPLASVSTRTWLQLPQSGVKEPLGSHPYSCSASVWAQLLTAAGAAGASPCWGGRQAQAGDLLGHGTSMAFRCLDGPPPLAGRVGDADVMAGLTQPLPLCSLCDLLVFL